MPSETTTADHSRAHVATVVTTVLTILLLSLVAALPATATPPLALPDQITDPQTWADQTFTATASAPTPTCSP